MTFTDKTNQKPATASSLSPPKEPFKAAEMAKHSSASIPSPAKGKRRAVDLDHGNHQSDADKDPESESNCEESVPVIKKGRGRPKKADLAEAVKKMRRS